MGMFKNDVLFGGLRLADELKVGTIAEGIKGAEQVVLLDAQVVSEGIQTEIGIARKTRLVINRLKDGVPEGAAFEVSTLAQAVASKVEEGEPGDLPAVVGFFITEASKDEFNDALVMQFISRYDGPDLALNSDSPVAPLIDAFTGEVSNLYPPPTVTKPSRATPKAKTEAAA